MHDNRLLAFLVACLLLTAGCSSGGGDQSGDGAVATDEGGGGAPAGTDAGGQTGKSTASGGGAAAAVDGRKLVRTAELTLAVDSFGATRSNLSAAARAAGGYVGDASMETHEYGNETYTEGRIVLRVPVGNYSDFLATVEREGSVRTLDENVDDVTRRYVDLQARLENLRAERDRLRALYERANDTEEVLAVEERLSEVQGEIERVEGRLRTLQNRVAYATVAVTVVEERPDRAFPERSRWYDVGLAEAFLDSADGVVVAARALAVAAAYAAPYLLAFGLPLVGLAAVLRRLRRGGRPAVPGRDGEE